MDYTTTTPCQQQGDGDIVTVTATDKPGVVEIASIEGDGGRLSLDPDKNCVGIAARETLALLGNCSCGVSLTLNKVGENMMVLHGGNALCIVPHSVANHQYRCPHSYVHNHAHTQPRTHNQTHTIHTHTPSTGSTSW